VCASVIGGAGVLAKVGVAVRTCMVMHKSGMSKGQNDTGVQRYREMELGFETSPVVDMVL
jgi:hypothetical protein